MGTFDSLDDLSIRVEDDFDVLNSVHILKQESLVILKDLSLIEWNLKLQSLLWSYHCSLIKNESSELHGQSLCLLVSDGSTHLSNMLVVNDLVVIIECACLQLLQDCHLEGWELCSNKDNSVLNDLLLLSLFSGCSLSFLSSLLLATSLLGLLE